MNATKTKANKRGRTVILSMHGGNRREKWVRWLEDNSEAKAGPMANILETRKKWGEASLIVKAGMFLFRITRKDDGRQLPWE